MKAGLSSDEVLASRARHGSNRLAEIRGRSFRELLREALRDRTLRILMACAAAVMVVDLAGGGHITDGIAILMAVAVASLVTATNDWRAQAEFRSLQLQTEARQVRVVRDGEVQLLSAFDLVVGDRIELERGDKVPADGELVEANELQLDESMMTGEPGGVSRRPGEEGGLRAGTMVLAGRGTMVVSGVGEATEYGRLRAQLAVEQDPTPLQVRLGRLADRIGLLGLGGAIAIFLALTLAALFAGKLGLDLATLRLLLTHVAIGVTIVVVAVPEGLPVAVTISLAWSVRKMARDRCLVRRLMACETMGGADVLCVDKTGTLTHNKMRCERLWFLGADEPQTEEPDLAPDWLRPSWIQVAAIDSTAHLRGSSGGESIGNPTEVALLQRVADWGEDYLAWRQGAQLVQSWEFSSDRKRMSTLIEREGGHRLLCKGAPELVLERCTRVLGPAGAQPLDEAARAEVEAALTRWAGLGMRTLALAARETDGAPASAEEAEQDLVLIAVVGIGDPLRAEVPLALARCRQAGVEVKMVTGDALLTARTVAREAGMLGPDDLVMEGDRFRGLGDEELRPMLPRLRVLARAVPSDKLRLVELLKQEQHIVGVTGDGTNDGPALRHADVGMSMGLSGTDVAREASDIVILDDDFSSVVRAVRWGRSIFENIRKFLQFQLTVSLVALCTAFFAAITGMGTPLTVVQLLWVNLIMDTLAALALAVDEPDDSLLDRPPHGRAEPLISRSMWVSIATIGGLMLLVLSLILWTDLVVYRPTAYHATFVFNAFVFMQIGNMINCRTTRFQGSVLRGLRGSRIFLLVFGLIVVLQVLIVQYGGALFKTTPLLWHHWLICLGLALGVVVAGALLRLAGRRFPVERAATLGTRLFASARTVFARYEPGVRAWASRPASHQPLGLVAAAGGLAMVGGLVARSLGPLFTPPGFALFCGGLAAVACWAWERRAALRSADGSVSTRLHTAASIGLALVLLIQANLIAVRHPQRIDLTATRSFSLSEQTRAILASIDQPVRFTTVFRGGALAEDVRDLLAEYAAAGPLVEVHHIDPDRNPGEVERLADRASLSNPSLASVVVEHRGRARVVAGEEMLERAYEYRDGRRYRVPNKAPMFRGEEALSSAVVALHSDDQIRVCFLSGHGERQPDDFEAEGLALFRDRLRRSGFLVSTFALLDGASIPPACSVLVQAGPRQELSEGARDAIGAYLRAGGKWMLTIEPWQTAGLDPLLAEWGLEVRPLFLLDPSQNVAGLGPTNLVASNYPPHVITAGLAGVPVVMPYATSVRRRQAERALEGANLVLTSKQGIGKTTRNTRDLSYEEGVDRRGDLAVAAAVDEPPALYAADGRREPARIVAIGDTDFFTNAHLHRMGNADFALNSLEWLARREALIAVRARSPDERQIALTAATHTGLTWMAVGLIPAMVGLLGGAVAWRRRQ